MSNKKCNKCGKEFPATTEYFYKNKNNKDGLHYTCKECYKKQASNYQKNNENYINKKKQRDSEYYAKNKDRIIKRQLKYYYNNKDNYELYYIENKDKILEYQKEYKETHQEIIKNNDRKKSYLRRSKMLENSGSYSIDEWLRCLNFFQYKCCYSGQDLTEENMTADHIIPVSKGGTNYIFNIACCDFRINSSKGAKDLEEWYRKQPFFSEERLNRIYEWIKINS